MEIAFTNIYEKKTWGDNGDPRYSGSSGTRMPREYIDFLRNFIRENGIKSVADLGCGDFHAGPAIYSDLDASYVGYDVYAKMIGAHSEAFPRPKYEFRHIDFSQSLEGVDPADLCVVKDVLQHWTDDQIEKFLDNCVSSGKFKHVLLINGSTKLPQRGNNSIGRTRYFTADHAPFVSRGFEMIFEFKCRYVFHRGPSK